MESTQDLEGIAIIGMSGRFPGARNVEQLWENLVAGKECISRFSDEELEFSVVDTDAQAAGVRRVAARGILEDVDKFDAAFFGIYPKEAELMDPQHRIFLECAWESLESAGYNPDSYPGLIGVFAGVSLNTYLLYNLSSDGRFANQLAGNYQVGQYHAMLGNDKDFLPTRVSYKLNLKGPSMAIQTACSSSLVAISQACSSLLGYQSDMALAGGVSITFPQKRDYLYEEDGMVSVDGTCRTFDSEAKGTVFGHGCAVLLLKRLSDAVKDGDNILAVIRGSAINNDGSDKVGYAAPSVNAQADVIAMAQAAADVNPDTISYVEAHGTGTPLGDPIEIAALTKAFQEGGAKGKSYCAIGTGKPNISHLDVAAGATGVIKTVMQLQHGVIPPLLNYRSPNPKIDFANSPFFPVTRLLDWKRGEKPRRAGISAFGVGGTNAHVVLEEAPLRKPRVAASNYEVFPLSARTEPALAIMKENLANRIVSDPDIDLADVAYTLQVGRKEFDHRWIAVASSREQLIEELRSDRASGCQSTASAGIPKCVFLFPGQGSQYVDMGWELYRDEPVYRNAVDQCAGILMAHLGRDVRHVLYPKDEKSRVEALREINQTWMTQPAIFVVEYALAKLWESRGIKPDVVIGHSIGEYVCAVLAESLGLDDALALLSLRAKLMAALPTGAMLSVRLSATEIDKLLPQGAVVAAANSPKLCVVAGSTRTLELFAEELTSKGIASRMLATSHAFHSSMMDPMLREFTEACSNKLHRSPCIHWISSCTGKEITSADLADASYWSRQLRQTVLFQSALDRLLEKSSNYVFLEVGPGRALNQFVRQHPAQIPANRVIATLGDSEKSVGENEASLIALGRLWLSGGKPAWGQLHAKEQRYRVPLPTYPFERRRYWVEPVKLAVVAEENRVEGIRCGGTEKSEGEFSESLAVQKLNPDVMSINDDQVSQPTTPKANRKEQIAKELRAIFLDLSGMSIEDDSACFIDLGFDSLFLTQASQAIDAKFKVKITFRQLLGELSSVAAIVNLLDIKLPREMFAEKPFIQDSPAQAISRLSSTKGNALEINEQSLTHAADVEKMLEGHIKNIEQLLQKSRSERTAVTNSSASVLALRTVRKSQETSEVQASARPDETKRFGPYKPIEKGEKGGLTAVQQDALNRLTERYVKRTSGSKRYTAEHRSHFADPRAVAGFRSQWKEIVYPIVSVRSKGSKIWDVDGNEYIDITMGFGTYFFGHSPDWLITAIEEQLKKGIEIGPQSPLAGSVAKMIAEMTGLDRVTFCNTGSEAVMAAMRLARAVTGRNRIVYFAGDYHGMFEEVLVRGAWPNGEYRAQPIAPGIPASLVENILVLEYGSQESLDIIRQHGDEIAAVMVEPVQSRNPSLQPKTFLQQLRVITEEMGAALIFDEVVTGFRCHQGGAQAYFGVRADMATYGKVVGGGMPIGILAGIPKYMDALDGGQWQYGDDSFPEVGVTFFAGTFVRHPLAIAAANAVLKFLKESGPGLQVAMTAKVEKVCQTVNGYMEELEVPIRMSSFSAFAAIDYAPDLKYASLLWYYLREKGIHIWEGRPCYFTLAHTDEDLERFSKVFKECVIDMQRDGFLPKPDDLSRRSNDFYDASSFPLAEGQREMWLGAQMSPEAAGPHHACNGFILEGQLDLDAMRNAIAMVIKRHEALRSVFSTDGTTVIVQPDLSLDVPLIDLSSLATHEREQRIQQIMESEGRRIFDLTNGPLISFQILKLSDTKHQMVITAQMIVCDGWSHYVLFEEISEIYSAIRERRSPVLRNVIPMREYARWQQDHWKSSQAKECEKYWLSQFESIPDPIDLPTKGLRPLLRSVAAQRRDLFLSADFYEQIKRFGRSSKTSSFAVLLSVYGIWLHRLSNATDLVIGVPFSVQNSLGFDTLVGQCANTLPIRLRIHPNERFQDILSRTWDALLDAQENPHYTFGKLLEHLDVKHDPSRIPLVSALFNIDPALTKVKFSGLRHHFFAGPRFYYQFDLGFNLVEEVGGLRVECDFNTNLFDADIVDQWLNSYELLLRDVLAGFDQSVAMLPMIVEQKEGVCRNREEGVVEIEDVAKLWEERVNKSPDDIVVSDNSRSYSARDLDRYSDQLAQQLRVNVPDGDLRVGVLAEPTADMLIAFLAVLKTAGAWVPIDPHFTKDQFEHIISDAAVNVLVVDHDRLEWVSHLEQPVIDLQLRSDSAVDRSVMLATAAGDATACILYVSGTVGPPKGVEITRTVLDRVAIALRNELSISASDKLMICSSLTTKRSLLEILLFISTQAKAVAFGSPDRDVPANLAKRLEQDQVTLFMVTPTVLRQMLCVGWRGNRSQKVLVDGAGLETNLAEKLLKANVQLWTLYGYPESGLLSSVKRVLSGKGITLGNPTVNNFLYIVDDQLALLPVGVPGRIVIGGNGLAKGYRNAGESSASRFIRRSDCVGIPECFLSDDYGRRQIDGEIEYLGNIDRRILLGGQPLNLTEIESILRSDSGVSDAAIVISEDLLDEASLVAVVVREQNPPSPMSDSEVAVDLRRKLRAKLPQQKVPNHFVFSSMLPTTFDGTIDRTKLDFRLSEVLDLKEDIAAPATETERRLVEIWQEVLRSSKIGIHDNFFDLGGTSLLAVRVFQKIASTFERKLPLATLFKSPTIAEIAAILDVRQLVGCDGWASLIPIQTQGDHKPLFLVHGAGGNVLLYQALAKRLSPDYPLYGLQSQGLDGESEPLKSIEEMAARYIREIRAIQSAGPYYLGGYCLGGTIAYEMAQQLVGRGEQVALVAMLDTYNFSRALKSSFVSFVLQKLRFHIGNFIRLRPSHMVSYLKEKIRVARDGELVNLLTSRPGFDAEEGEGRATAGAELAVQTINDTAAEVYIPKPYSGTLTIFKPRINYKFYPDPKMGWGDLAMGGLDIVEFPFNPHAMLVEPYVEQLSEALVGRLAKVDGGVSLRNGSAANLVNSEPNHCELAKR